MSICYYIEIHGNEAPLQFEAFKDMPISELKTIDGKIGVGSEQIFRKI